MEIVGDICERRRSHELSRLFFTPCWERTTRKPTHHVEFHPGFVAKVVAYSQLWFLSCDYDNAV